MSRNWTQEQANSYLARQAVTQRVCSRLDAAQDESDLHSQIADECRRRGFIALHGSMAHRTHRLCGEADFTCLLPEGRVLFVECKSRTGKLTTDQVALAHWMASLGHKMHVVRSLREFLELIK